MENKFGKIKSIEEAMTHVTDGCTIMIAGFGGIGSSYDLIQAIIKAAKLSVRYYFSYRI